MKKLIILLLMIISITLTGCWDQKIFEDIGFVLQIGVESSKDNKLLVSLVYPVINIENKNQANMDVNKVTDLREAREKSRMTSSQTLEAGKVQQILLSKEIAKKGVHNLFEITERDPTNPALAFVVVVDGSPKELIKKLMTFKDKPRPSFYINKLLEGNVKDSYIPETRVYNFDIAYFAQGLDPITPLIKLETDKVKVIGSALFSEDRMVGSIDTRQTSLLLAMMNKIKKTEYISSTTDFMEENEKVKRGIALLLRDSKRKIDIKIKDNKPVINISLRFNGVLDEFKWDRTNIPEQQNKLENILCKEIENECIKIIKYMQNVGSDPIGFGDIIRAKYNSYWNSIDWKKAYKDAEINVDVKLNVVSHGVID